VNCVLAVADEIAPVLVGAFRGIPRQWLMGAVRA
jgi:hypothetical protein